MNDPSNIERARSASRTRAAAPQDTDQDEAQNVQGHAAQQQAAPVAAQQGVKADTAMVLQLFQMMQNPNLQSQA
ncbi:hypothetical protein PsorP6_010686 [Peronosclerospora sorghi]|uniref:Uncharacterized protein n=1 Tax=Peronosclerospora sorghi TaxID=230839 RepID=A0ACC0VV71_9STRA|nr:hypothetical protein PsorP6_010686 [Peronosclerospora sorghi]